MFLGVRYIYFLGNFMGKFENVHWIIRFILYLGIIVLFLTELSTLSSNYNPPIYLKNVGWLLASYARLLPRRGL